MRTHVRELACLRAGRSSSVVVPLLTNEVMRSLSSCEPEVWETKEDFLIVEYLWALHLQSSNAVSLLYPLLVGEELFNAQLQRLEWDNLLQNKTFKMLLAALPDVVPRASFACASSIVADNDTAPFNLPSHITVRDIVSGKMEVAVPMADTERVVALNGILSMDAFPLACALIEDLLDLYIRAKFVANIRKADAFASSGSQSV